ncbi:amino acid/amide ABC transporter membrane protein 2 (HAAT family) [Micromonospora palomenae]|uniref:Amino acid/amide ABC transporter membrane protein 2 (HAAT family) n=1 Tax=Micromonospora palomenae TaxID=1461247 RepID=A0A561VFG9_9ACTN|nr:branched-chain amino acid ABC transporter permease [Micromonospora palomenae]TWG10357.1 amino acid/amide ABC transporter membrane protein 2 (HAAT family) [Micromonospora palomenae]
MIDKIRNADRRRVGMLTSVGDRFRALPKWQQIAALVALVAFLYYLPYLGIPGLTWLRTDSIAGGNNWAGVLFVCAIYVLVAIGLNVVVGLAGLLDLGYIGFFAVGAYSVALFGSVNSPVVKWIQREFDLPPTWAVTWSICLLLAIVLTMVFGVLLGWPTLRLRGDYLAIVTLGFGEIIRIVARNANGVTNGPQGISAIPGPEGPPSAENEVFGLIDAKPWYWLAITVVLLMVFAVRRLERSRVGRAWLAVREDEDAAAVMGVYPFKFKLWAFAIGAALGGLSGFLFASRNAFIDPTQFNANLSILFVAMVVVGGSGNMVGVSLGAVLLAYLPERFREIADYRWLAFGLAMVLVMILRPQGLVPSRRRARELKDRAAEAEEAPAHV